MLSAAKGVFIVAQTPFDETGAIDGNSIDSLCEFYFRHGADGLTVLGVSGEAGKLTSGEAVAVAARFIGNAGTRPVVVGVSSPSLAQLGELTTKVMDHGAAGVMIAPPAGLKTDEDLLAYFDAVYTRIGDVPTVLQDFPQASDVWMSVPAMLRLIDTFPQLQLIKEEDLPSLGKIGRLRESTGRRVPILTGNNAMYLPLELARGADGPMAGFSYPEMLSGVYRRHTAGDLDGAERLFARYLPLLRYEAMGSFGIAARKEVMRRRGAIRHATVRTPGPRLTPTDLAEIDRLVAQVDRSVADLT
ncbi:dihydrodipicolinate synthase family protein [Nonomuraea sp. NPDC050404]|uniref:dihydrodipicolinate synthase family protein n=1 Tax=Nonomuraea sp. NPDC050404 TaxID=3155783 RepID=UPI0033F4A394